MPRKKKEVDDTKKVKPTDLPAEEISKEGTEPEADGNAEIIDDSDNAIVAAHSELYNLVAQLKLYCSCNKIPMYIILSLPDGYYRDCLYASLSLNKRDERIANLLLATMGGEETLPPHIEKCIQDLNNYLDKKRIIQHSRENLNLNTDDDIQHIADIGDGFVDVKTPQEILNGGIRYDEDIDSLPDYEESDDD